MSAPVVLPVPCPICDARAGDPCEDYVNGWITARPTPHLYRVHLAREEGFTVPVTDLECLVYVSEILTKIRHLRVPRGRVKP